MRQKLQRAAAAWVKIPYLPLWLVPLLLFLPILLTGKALFWGTPALQFVPWLNRAWESLASGQLPFWNDLVGMGAPLLANYQSALLYPPTWTYFLLAAIGGVPALAWGQALLVVLHLAWSGFGMAILARRLEMGSLAQAVAGLSFSVSGYMVARAGFLSINATAAWLPWMLIPALDLARRHQVNKSILLLAVAAGFQLLAGHAQTAAYSSVLVFAWIGFWSWAGFPSEKHSFWITLKAGGTAVVGLLGGVALAAVQLLPTAEYLMKSQRAAAVDYEVAMTYSFWPWRLLSFVTPDLFGSPVHGDYWGYGAYWEDAIYVGLVPFLLGVGLILSSIFPRKKTDAESGASARLPTFARQLIIALAALLVLTFILAFGQNTPIFPWLYRNIPGFDMFQAPTRFTIWAVFAFSILGGLGVEAWRRPTGRGLYWTRLGTAGAFAVSLGAGISWAFLGDVRPTFIRATALAGFWGLGMGVLALTGPDRETDKGFTWWPWAVIILLSADLLLAGWGLNPGVEADFYGGRSSTAENVEDRLGTGRLYLAPAEEYSLKFERFLRFQSYQAEEDLANLRETLLPYLHMLDAIPHTANFDPLVPGRYTRWMAGIDNADSVLKEKLLNLSGVTMVEITDSKVPLGVDFLSIDGAGSRFRWVNCASWVSNQEASWDAVMAPAFDPETGVVLEGDNSSNRNCTGAKIRNLQVLDEQSNRVSIQVDADGPGWLVQSDVWFPGWTASVDGDRVPLLEANYLFRGVPVPEGDHQVDIIYRPLWFYVGLFLSVGAWTWIGVNFVRQRR